MLDPLRGKKIGRIACRVIGGRDHMTLVAFSGPQPVAELADGWRFATHVSALRGAYHERWRPLNETRKRYYLDRAYLHLYIKTRADGEVMEKEMLALHCDPNEPKEPAGWVGLIHSKYRRGPHLHISVAEQPIPHSHFALNACHLDSVLGSIESLSEAIAVAISMLEDQVLRLYEA